MDALLGYLLIGSHGLFAYGTIFAILVACGLGVPLPEDIALILGGFLAHQGAVMLPYMVAVGFVGILAGDSLIFLAGRRVGERAMEGQGFLARVVTPRKRQQVEGLFARHGQKIVMLARFLPGVRAVTYFTAGSAGMSYTRFVLFDGLAALASAPLFVWMGFHFGGELAFVIHKIKEFQLGVLSGLVLLLVVTLVVRQRRAASGSGRTPLSPVPALEPRDSAIAPSDRHPPTHRVGGFVSEPTGLSQPSSRSVLPLAK